MPASKIHSTAESRVQLRPKLSIWGNFRGRKLVKPTASTGFLGRAMGIELHPRFLSLTETRRCGILLILKLAGVLAKDSTEWVKVAINGDARRRNFAGACPPIRGNLPEVPQNVCLANRLFPTSLTPEYTRR